MVDLTHKLLLKWRTIVIELVIVVVVDAVWVGQAAA